MNIAKDEYNVGLRVRVSFEEGQIQILCDSCKDGIWSKPPVKGPMFSLAPGQEFKVRGSVFVLPLNLPHSSTFLSLTFIISAAIDELIKICEKYIHPFIFSSPKIHLHVFIIMVFCGGYIFFFICTDEH